MVRHVLWCCFRSWAGLWRESSPFPMLGGLHWSLLVLRQLPLCVWDFLDFSFLACCVGMLV